MCCVGPLPRTPKYLLEASSDGEEFVIIRFTAGPPYEDLAFKVGQGGASWAAIHSYIVYT